MPTTPDSFQPTPEGKSLIEQLGPLPLEERITELIKFWKNRPEEKLAILDAFHFLITEAIQSSKEKGKEQILDFNDDFSISMPRWMKENRYYFGYPNGREFFKLFENLTPPIFSNILQMKAAFQNFFPDRPAVNPEFGFPEEYDDSVLEKCKVVCEKAAEAHLIIEKFRPSMVSSQRVLINFKAGNKGVTEMDLELAKETFQESRIQFQKAAEIIADGMNLIHQAHNYYPDVLVLHQIYNKYLAILLASREARYPPERYVELLATGPFNYVIPQFVVNSSEEGWGITAQRKEKEYQQDLKLILDRLECRYRKRKLMARMKQGEPQQKILKELIRIVQIDPDDIRTHILLARIYADLTHRMQHPIKSQNFREQALHYCETAFAKIDTFLDLQGITNVRERDMQRVGFVKTISNIRLPLVRGRKS